MLRFPEMFEVQLTAPNGALFEVPSVMVTIRVYHEGRYYFGGIVTLSDSSGVARFQKEQIAADFAENQRMFPMDYRVPLEECDAKVQVMIPGDSEFDNARDNAFQSALLLPRFRAMWNEAVNGRLRSSRVLLDVTKLAAKGRFARATVQVQAAR